MLNLRNRHPGTCLRTESNMRSPLNRLLAQIDHCGGFHLFYIFYGFEVSVTPLFTELHYFRKIAQRDGEDENCTGKLVDGTESLSFSKPHVLINCKLPSVVSR